ncbi:MAG: aminoglycoside 6-adenylyltransferase [Actinocatenispora sp.]
MERDELIERIADVLRAEPMVRAAWLVGSIGRGTDDEYSDVDVWAVVAPEDIDAFAEAWPEASGKVADIVLRQGLGKRIFTHVTADWLRFDLSVGTPDDVSERPRDAVRPLFDHDGLADRLGDEGPPLAPSADRVAALSTEFLRVLGLLPVVLGRREYVVAAAGAGLLRTLLIRLYTEDVAVADRGGALHLAALLPPERYEALAALPPVEATRESALRFHVACAELFLPVARELAARSGADWPQALEDAALRHLERDLDVKLARD